MKAAQKHDRECACWACIGDLKAAQNPLLMSKAIARFGAGFLQFWCDCRDGSVEVVCVVTSNRDRQFRPRCGRCGYVAAFNLAHRLLTDSERRGAPIIRVNKPTPAAKCARCGKWGAVEDHHWAPRALFPDADLWPTAKLCRACHVRWHQIIDRREVIS
jgi:hypothetical protein